MTSPRDDILCDGPTRVWITGETDRGKGFSTHLRTRFSEIYLGVKICRCLPCPAHTIGPLLCSPLTGDSSRLNTQARPLSEGRPFLGSPHQRESFSQQRREPDLNFKTYPSCGRYSKLTSMSELLSLV